MRKQILAVVAFALSVSLVACGPNVKTFNDRLVAINNTLQTEAAAIANKLGAITNSKNFAALTPDIKKLNDHITEYEAEIKKMEAPKSGEKFKNAILDYLGVLKEVSSVYTDFTKLSTTASDAEINKLVEKANTVSAKEEKLINAAMDAQKDFASKNSMKLQ